MKNKKPTPKTLWEFQKSSRFPNSHKYIWEDHNICMRYCQDLVIPKVLLCSIPQPCFARTMCVWVCMCSEKLVLLHKLSQGYPRYQKRKTYFSSAFRTISKSFFIILCISLHSFLVKFHYFIFNKKFLNMPRQKPKLCNISHQNSQEKILSREFVTIIRTTKSNCKWQNKQKKGQTNAFK